MSLTTPGPDELFEDEQGQDQGPNPLMILHRALRGRYHLAVLLGLVLGIPCATGGYLVLKPVFTSQAVLEANPTDETILFPQDQTAQLASAFEAFVQQQATTLQSERVLSIALDDTGLREAGWPTGITGLIRLRNGLSIATPRRTNQIFVSVSNTDHSAAQAAARAVIRAYMAIREETERTMFGEREDRLVRLSDQYLRERNEKRKVALERALSVANTEDLEGFQRATLDELDDINDQIRELTVLLSLAGGAMPGDAVLPPDSKLERLTEDRDLLRRQLDSLLLTVTPQHRQAKQLARQIKVLDAEITAREAELGFDSDDTGEDAEPGIVGDPSRLEARIADLQRMRQETETLLERIGRTRLDVLALTQEADIANTRYEDASRRLEGLRVEKNSQIMGRIRVAQEPESPLLPSTDRRVPLAGMGFVGGFGTGLALVTAYGLVFPRVRVADDVMATQRDFSMLGMIPEFPENGDRHEALNVRESFHFLRVILDARSGPDGIVCGITSPTSGDGKTTIAVRLARSFAASRREVLLIDADLVGRGATRALGVRPSQSMDDEQATLSDMVVHVEEGGFDMIPASDSMNASEIFCGHTLRSVLASARERYAVVLVDTGPILGSIEAAAATPAMDQMLLVISRGLESRLLKMATDRLRELKARSVGIVFNRASTVDFNRSFAPPSSMSRQPPRAASEDDTRRLRRAMLGDPNEDEA